MYKTVYQAAFWTMQKTDQQLPDDLDELLKVLAITKQQQLAAQQQQQQEVDQQHADRSRQQQQAPNTTAE